MKTDDGTTEYEYKTVGRCEGAKPGERVRAAETAIHVTLFDKTGMPYNGHSVAKYRDGKWNLTPSD